MFRSILPAIGLLCLVLLLPVAGWGENPLEPVPEAALDAATDVVPDAAGLGAPPQEKAGADPFPNEVWNAPATDSVDAGPTQDEPPATAGADLGEVAAAKADPNFPNVKEVSTAFKSNQIAKVTKIMTKEGQKVWGGKLAALKKAGLLTRIGGLVKFINCFANNGQDALLNTFKVNRKTYAMIMRREGEVWKVSHLMELSGKTFPPPPWAVSFPPSLLPSKTPNKPLPY